MSPIADMLIASAVRPSELPICSSRGIYAIWLIDADDLPPIAVGTNRLLYVGMTEHGLDARNHFHHDHSGFSTLRRSLGAVLKEELGLKALPRGPGASKSNVRNYRFDDDGERALTRWMNGALNVSQVALDIDVAVLEKELIRSMEPPLNLTGWPNPQRALLKKLRASCKEEAARHVAGA